MSKRRILVIDDEIDLCKIVKLNLERTQEFEVVMAFSGEDGIREAQASEFDLVITDFNLPGINGGAVVTAMKAMKPDSPVVLCTVYYDDPDTIGPDVLKKVDGVITKPCTHDEMYRVVKSALERGRRGTVEP
jgi:DNA-binding NtrC family response regulator